MIKLAWFYSKTLAFANKHLITNEQLIEYITNEYDSTQSILIYTHIDSGIKKRNLKNRVNN